MSADPGLVVEVERLTERLAGTAVLVAMTERVMEHLAQLLVALGDTILDGPIIDAASRMDPKVLSVIGTDAAALLRDAFDRCRLDLGAFNDLRDGTT